MKKNTRAGLLKVLLNSVENLTIGLSNESSVCSTCFKDISDPKKTLLTSSYM